MTGPDIILSFVISYAAGKLQQYMQPDFEHLLEKCYNKALNKWSVNEQIRQSVKLGYHRHVQQLSERILHSKKGMNPNEKELVVLWINELRKDKEACHIIQNMQIDAILQLSIDSFSKLISELNEIDSKHEELLSNTEEIKAALQKNTEVIQTIARNLNGLDIICDDTIELICPVPPCVALRSDYIDDLKRILDQKNSIHIFGGWCSGKSVTSCLLAQRYEDYTKILIPLSSIPQVSLYSLDVIAKEDGKKIIILDGININDSDFCFSLCRLINRLKSVDTLFIINSYGSFAKENMTGKSSIYEVEVPAMSLDDVKSMLSETLLTWSELLYSVTAGQPQLVQLAVNYVSSEGFKPTDEAITNLFTFSGEMSLADKCRTALGRMVSNPDALELLNRLLLFEGFFSEEDCRAVAGVEPVIRVPMTCLASMMGKWVQSNNGEYNISPLLKKTLKPDLNTYVNRDCCDKIADIIIGRGSLSITDTLSVFTLYIRGGLYEKAAMLYVQVLYYLSDKGLLETKGATLFKGIWQNMPLPANMPDDIKISIRLAQVAILGMKEPEQFVSTAEDLEHLLDSVDVNKRKDFSRGYIVLSGYYLLSGAIAKSNEVKTKVIPSEEIQELENKLDGKQLRLFQFYSVKTLDNLKYIMDQQASEDFIPFDFYYDGCYNSIRNVVTGISIEAQNERLHSIIDYAYEHNIARLFPFAISCVSALIKESSDKHDIACCETLYDQFKDLLAYDFGRLQLNYSLAVAYECEGNKCQAEEYFAKAASVTDLGINAYESMVAHVSYTKYLGEHDSQGALGVLIKFMKYCGFDSYLTDEQRMLFFGSLSIAYWFCGKQVEAVKMSNIVMDGIYKHKENPSDAYKELAIKHGAVLTQYMNFALHGEEESNSITLCYDMYFNSIRDFLELYSPARIFGCLAITCLVNDLIIKNDDSTYEYVKRGLEYCKMSNHETVPALILSNMVPLMLSMDDIDGVEYLMAISADSMTRYDDKPKNVDLTQLSTCLLQITCYRARVLSVGRYFDDNRIRVFVRNILGRLNRTEYEDEYLKCIGDEAIDYNAIVDEHKKTIAYIWHLNDYSASNVLILLHRVYVLWSQNWKQHSLISSLNDFFEALLRYQILLERQAFNLSYVDVDGLIRKARQSIGYESSKRIAMAYYFLLKNPPQLNPGVEEFFEG